MDINSIIVPNNEAVQTSGKFNPVSIFPTPIICSSIDRLFTDDEKEVFNHHSNHTRSNMGNTTSIDAYVLKDNRLKDIKSYIEEGINYYVNNIICPRFSPLEFYITQSWLNYTKEGQYHHKHEHPNSIISGVFYIDADYDKDKIFFYRSNAYKQISFPVERHNVWNSESWFFQVKPGDLVLFPSSLTHMVETKSGSNTRCSLSFNVFAKGYFGEEEAMTALHL